MSLDGDLYFGTKLGADIVDAIQLTNDNWLTRMQSSREILNRGMEHCRQKKKSLRQLIVLIHSSISH
jgi:hypothetical protein